MLYIFDLIGAFFKRIWSPNLIILIPVIFIGWMLFHNTSSLFSWFGYESKESVQHRLSITEQALQTANLNIEELKKKNALQDVFCKMDKDYLNKYNSDSNEVDDIINSIIGDRNFMNPTIPNVKPIIEETKDPSGIVEDRSEVTVDSVDHIEAQKSIASIHKAYNAFFGE